MGAFDVDFYTKDDGTQPAREFIDTLSPKMQGGSCSWLSMLDKNGIEIKTGDIVEITGAFFKNNNDLYFVQASQGDAFWSGSDHRLKRISKAGKISTAKYSHCF